MSPSVSLVDRKTLQNLASILDVEGILNGLSGVDAKTVAFAISADVGFHAAGAAEHLRTRAQDIFGDRGGPSSRIDWSSRADAVRALNMAADVIQAFGTGWGLP